MEEPSVVIALTFEKLNSRRARHLRAIGVWEEALRRLAETSARTFISRRHRPATARCRRSRAVRGESRLLRRRQGLASETFERDMPAIDPSMRFHARSCGRIGATRLSSKGGHGMVRDNVGTTRQVHQTDDLSSPGSACHHRGR